MANVKLLFYGTEQSGTQEISIECFRNSYNEITIKIDEGRNFPLSFISLDKQTSIKLSKELRKQIALID
jgi:hypothetical protein